MDQESLLKRALDRHADRLSVFPNVQAVGISTKPIAETKEAGNEAVIGQLGLVVYVTKKVPIEELPVESRIPDSVEVEDDGGTIRQVPVHVIETGQLKFQDLH